MTVSKRIGVAATVQVSATISPRQTSTGVQPSPVILLIDGAQNASEVRDVPKGVSLHGFMCW